MKKYTIVHHKTAEILIIEASSCHVEEKVYVFCEDNEKRISSFCIYNWDIRYINYE